ncbi:MAG: RNA-guided endonuclease TnpB family protein, partial [Paludibacter sp.]
MKSIKVRLELNNKQTTLANKHAGVARYAYNWGKSVCDLAIQNKEHRPTAIDLHKKFVAEEKTIKPWLYEVSKCSPQQGLRNLDEAYKRIFKVNGSRFPRFKKKGQHDSFYLEGTIKIDNSKIKVPKFGWFKCSEILPQCEVKNAVISKTANQWFIAFKIPFEPKITNKTNGVVGVDLGVKTLAMLSDGKVFEAIKPYKKNRRKLKILQRKLSKKQKGSNNRKKAVLKVAKLHYRIANIRKDTTHKLTTYLSKNHTECVIEDLNVKGMSARCKPKQDENGKYLPNGQSAKSGLNNSILDGGFSEFRRQLEYKCKWYGSSLTIVDRFYPSSKTCSSCGNIKKDLKLSDRVYVCENCGLVIDRDLNAAINLRNKSASYAESACGVPKQLDTLVSGGAM